MANFLQGEVDVPVLGKSKKWVIYGVGGLAAAYVAYRWYSSGTSDEEETTDDLTYNPDLSEYGQSTAGGPFNVGGNTGSTNTDGTNPNAIDDNAEWTNKAVELLSQAGYDPTVVYAALGEFLARRSLDKTEATIARAAIAAAGQPPVGRPWTVIEAAATGNVTLEAPKNLRVVETTESTVKLSWSAVPGAGMYRVYRSGSSFNAGATDAANTSITIGGLQPSTEYTFQVAADTTSAKPGPKSSSVKAKTKGLKLTAPTGLKASNITKTSFRVTANPVKGAQFYKWYFKGATGAWRASGASDQPYRDFTGLKSGSSYQIQVVADVSGQTPGPKSSTLTVKTKR